MSVITVRTSQGLRKVRIAGDEPTPEEIARMRELFEEGAQGDDVIPGGQGVQGVQGSPQPYMPDAGGTQTMPPPDLPPQPALEQPPPPKQVDPFAKFSREPWREPLREPDPNAPPELKAEYLSPEERAEAERKGKALRLVEQAYEQGRGVQSRIPSFMTGNAGGDPNPTAAGALGTGVGKTISSAVALGLEATGDPERAKQIDENIAKIPRAPGVLGLIEDMGQLITAGVPITKAANALKLGTFPKIATIGAGTGLVGWSGQQGRIADFVKEHTEIAKPVIDFLATDEDDSFAMGRFKNALEFAGVDTAVATPFVLAFRAWKGIAASAKPHGDVELANEISKGVKKADPNHVVRPPKDGKVQVAHSGAIQIPDKVVERTMNATVGALIKGGNKLMKGPLGDTTLVPLKQRVEQISPRMANQMDAFEVSSNTLRQGYIEIVIPLLKTARKMNKSDRKKFGDFLLNSEFADANAILQKYKNNGKAPGAMREFQDTIQALDDLHKLGNANGVPIPYRKNYWPRNMVNHEGFMKSIGKDLKDPIDEAIDKAFRAKNNVKEGQPLPQNPEQLTQFEKREVVREYLEGSVYKGDGTPGYVKERVIDKIKPEHMKFYGSFEENLINYINNVTYRVQKNRFTGKVKGVPGYNEEIARLRLAGEIDTKGANEISRLIGARLKGGEQSINVGAAIFRDATYLTKIGNFISTITQTSELMLNAFRNGALETAQTLGQTVKGKGMTIRALGLDDIAKEFTDPISRSSAGIAGGFQKALNWSLRKTLGLTGFKRWDVFSKESALNGAFLKARKQLANKNSPEYKQFAQDQAKFFEGETQSLIDAIRRGDMKDPNVIVFLFSKLSRTQPISLSEYPELYLKHPFMRPAYFLKSFGLKQLETTRREVLRKIASGNAKEIREGFRQGIRLSVYFGGGITGVNLFKDWLLDRDPNVGSAAADAFLTLFGLSRYSGRKIASPKRPHERPEGIYDLFLPPGTTEIIKGDVLNPKNIPFFGKMWTEWFGPAADYKRKARIKKGGRRGPRPPGPPKRPSPPKRPKY